MPFPGWTLKSTRSFMSKLLTFSFEKCLKIEFKDIPVMIQWQILYTGLNISNLEHFMKFKSSIKICHPVSCSPCFSVDLWEEKFIDCRMENTSFEHSKHGCHLNIVEDNDVLIYLVSFLGSLAVLPGNIISALYMEKIGRVKIIGDVQKCSTFAYDC